jgi:DnaK suppressor protein
MPTTNSDHTSYTPSDNEPFMSPRQLAYFRNKLLSWRDQLLRESSQAINQMQDKVVSEADIIDIACNEINQAIELRTRDRERKLINKINEAIRRIDEGSYGYCEVTGEPIGLKRLEARPIATLSLEAQEHHERRERIYREEFI